MLLEEVEVRKGQGKKLSKDVCLAENYKSLSQGKLWSTIVQSTLGTRVGWKHNLLFSLCIS